MDEQILVGKTVVGFRMIDEDQGVEFETENEFISFGVSADCCSDGWIEHIENSDYLITATVLSCVEIPGVELEDKDPRSSRKHTQESELIYFLKIKTDKGYVDIDFRNSSNGYYGTLLEWTSKSK